MHHARSGPLLRNRTRDPISRFPRGIPRNALRRKRGAPCNAVADGITMFRRQRRRAGRSRAATWESRKKIRFRRDEKVHPQPRGNVSITRWRQVSREDSRIVGWPGWFRFAVDSARRRGRGDGQLPQRKGRALAVTIKATVFDVGSVTLNLTRLCASIKRRTLVRVSPKPLQARLAHFKRGN